MRVEKQRYWGVCDSSDDNTNIVAVYKKRDVAEQEALIWSHENQYQFYVREVFPNKESE